MTHALKVWPEYYEAIETFSKNFEVRKNDRPFKVGEVLLLQEWDNKTQQYTCRQTTRTITYILEGGQFGIEPGYVVMGIFNEEDY